MDLVKSRGLDRETEERLRSQALIALSKRFVFKEDKNIDLWETLVNDRAALCEVLQYFDLTYRLEEFGDQGFAYLVPLGDSEEGKGLLSLTPIRTLTSYLLVVLRKTFKEFADEGRTERPNIEKEKLYELLKVYYGETTNWEVHKSNIDKQLKELQRLKVINMTGEGENHIVIHPIITSLIDMKWLTEFSAYLAEKKEEKKRRDREEKGEKEPPKRKEEKPEEDNMFALDGKDEEE